MRPHSCIVSTGLALALLAPGASAQFPIPQRQPGGGVGSRPGFTAPLDPRFAPQTDPFGRLAPPRSPVLGLSPTDTSGILGGLPQLRNTTGHPVAFFNYAQFYTFPFPRFGPNVGGSGTQTPTPPGVRPGSDPFNQNQLGARPGGRQRSTIGIGVR